MTYSNTDDIKLKIYQGAQAALVQYGLSKLTMSDVYRAAGISRATLYRYFASREELLREVSLWEERCFYESIAHALTEVAPENRVKAMLDQVTSIPQNYPTLIPLLENDPGYVLSNLRTLFPNVLEHMHDIMAPIVANSDSSGSTMTVDQLVDCFVRIALTIYLFPDPKPGATEKSLMALYDLWKSQSK